MRILTLAIALSFVACKDESAPDAEGEFSKWEFDNTVDAQGFETQAAELKKLLEQVKSKSVAPLPSSSMARGLTTTCHDVVDPLGVSAFAKGARMALTVGTDCTTALEGLSSFYRQALLASDIALGRLDGSVEQSDGCATNVAAAPTDPKTASKGFRFTAAGQFPELKHEELVLGGANDSEVAVHADMSLECPKSAGCTDDMILKGTTEARGNLREKILAYTASLDIDVIGQYQSQIDSRMTARGLKEGETLSLEEKTVIVQTRTDGSAEAPRVTELSFVVYGRGKGVHLKGSSKTTVSGNGSEQGFDIYLVNQSGACRVAKEPPQGTDGTGSGSGNGNGSVTPVVPSRPPLSAQDLQGTWVGACDDESLGLLGTSDFASARFDERLTYSGDTFSDTVTVYSDNVCFPGTERVRVQLEGHFAVTEGASNRSLQESGLDFTYGTLTVTLLDDQSVQRFNTARACNRADWVKGVENRFDAGACFFAMGSSYGPLLNTETLKRAREYTSARLGTGEAMLEVARTGFAGDQPAARPPVSNGSVSLKRRQ